MDEQRRQANNFRLEGKGLEVGYTLPRGSLTLQSGEFGDRTLEAEPYPLSIGTLATFTLQSTEDGDETTLTLLLPDVNLPADVE